MRTNVQTLKRDFDQPEDFLGPVFLGPLWLCFPMSSVALYTVALRLPQATSTIECSGWVWMAMGSPDFTKLLSLLTIALTVRRTGQTRKDGGSNPVKRDSQPMSGKQDLINILLINTTISIVANRSGPTIV